jgi:hypothetical protein
MADGNGIAGRNDTAFYIVFSVVFVITVSSLGLGLWKDSQRTKYVNQEIQRVESRAPKGDVKSAELQDSEYEKGVIRDETHNQQNTITILFGVFQAGTGAIIGLLTGRATAK